MMWSRVSVLSILSSLFGLLPSICLAQGSDGLSSDSPTASLSTASASSSTSSAAAQTHTISVGLADHKFRPESTNASVGDIIEFAFYPLNHSVVRAEYGYPCIPYEMTGQGKTGFFSGFEPVDSVLDFPPTYSIEIKNRDPIFFYCSAPGSCIGYGMVGVINPNTTTSIDQQHKMALDSSYMLNPGEPFPPESTSKTPGAGLTNNDTQIDLSAGAIAGISIAGVSVFVIVALLYFFWCRTKSLKDEVDRKAEVAGAPRLDPNNRSPPAMVERGPNRSTAMAGNGGDFYHQYPQRSMLSSPMADPAYSQYNYNQPYKSAAPSYYMPQPPPSRSPPPLPAQQYHPHQYKYDINALVEHRMHTLPPIPHQSPLNIHDALAHRSVGRPYELSPLGDCMRSPPNDRHHDNHDYNLDSNVAGDTDIISPAPSLHRYASPPPPPPRVLDETIPSYYETVYRPDPKHVNGMGTSPIEMDGRALAGNVTPVRTVTAKWEEVGEKAVGSGGA